MTDAEIIKKLAERIHNQRFALRQNWMIMDMRLKEFPRKGRPLQAKWWGYVLKVNKENMRLKRLLKISVTLMLIADCMLIFMIKG